MSYSKRLMAASEELGKIEGKIEVVKNLLEINMSIEDIVKVTGLSKEKIKEIKDNK